jgi:pimeloyl-ACP methyl ester carboxylesterase
LPALEASGDDRSVLFCLHYLGGSGREWARVAELLGTVRCVPIDLPGFGDAAASPGYSVAEMAGFVAEKVRLAAPPRWFLAGHSMGAKVAAVLDAAREDGARPLSGFEGLVLLAGSPPSPEPMDEKQRQTMLGWFSGGPDANRADARRYVASNSANDLDAEFTALAVADAVRANRAAWVAWLERGSREDWSARVGLLQTPALIIAGGDDENLGPQAQRDLTAPHFAYARLVTLPGAKHLLPLERPQDVADLIDRHVDSITSDRERSNSLNAAYRELIASNRVSSVTRRALDARAQPDDPGYEPAAMDAPALANLRAVLDRVLPQIGSERIDLGARLDKQLSAGNGDGWRFANLPPDAEACRTALYTLNEEALWEHGVPFHELDGVLQDDLLVRIAGGRFESTVAGPASAARLSASQMRSWFEDLRADAVKAYMGHPSTLAHMGYSGIAYGGDGEPKSGFVRVGIDEREAWEPVASSDVVR